MLSVPLCIRPDRWTGWTLPGLGISRNVRQKPQTSSRRWSILKFKSEIIAYSYRVQEWDNCIVLPSSKVRQLHTLIEFKSEIIAYSYRVQKWDNCIVLPSSKVRQLHTLIEFKIEIIAYSYWVQEWNIYTMWEFKGDVIVHCPKVHKLDRLLHTPLKFRGDVIICFLVCF